MKISDSKVIVLAAGDGSRWNNYRGTPKHLTVVEKEVLLQRTCKQFLRYTSDVSVIGLDNRYEVEGAKLYTVRSTNTNWKDAAKFMTSQQMWSRNGRTILVFGDVYFTNDAVKKIMSNSDEFKFFLRKGANEETGARSKEIFAFSFHSRMLNRVTQSLLMLISRGAVESHAGWALYKYMTGPQYGDMFNSSHFVEINDWTEDFDYPEDLEIWEEHRRLAKQARKKAKETL